MGASGHLARCSSGGSVRTANGASTCGSPGCDRTRLSISGPTCSVERSSPCSRWSASSRASYCSRMVGRRSRPWPSVTAHLTPSHRCPGRAPNAVEPAPAGISHWHSDRGPRAGGRVSGRTTQLRPRTAPPTSPRPRPGAPEALGCPLAPVVIRTLELLIMSRVTRRDGVLSRRALLTSRRRGPLSSV